MTPTMPLMACTREKARPAGRVLIADDYPDCADSLALLLELRGFETATVIDGAGVLPAADRFAPDVVVLDLVLPGCDGEEIARGLLNLPPDRRPRVIIATGFADEPRRERLEQIGVDAYLLKPTDPNELVACVRRACREHETPRTDP